MLKQKCYMAIDLGASNGRVIIGKYDNHKLQFEEIYRFENTPVFASGTLYWDVLKLFSELKIGIKYAITKYKNIASIGIDTWGVDFGLLDSNKDLLSNPVHYRDNRTKNVPEKVFELIPKKEIFKRTGTQVMELNSLFQLYSLKLKNSPILDSASYFLMMGDLFNYFLTGEIYCEYTNSTGSQMVSQTEKKWENHIINKLNIPKEIFPQIIEPGIIIGKINSEICNELECKSVPVAMVAYDTSSEITAIPVSSKNSNKNWAYLSCGTWSTIGVMLNKPVLSEDSYYAGFGNEGGVEGKYHFLKNMIGLWIIQQCRKKWMQDAGEEISWEEIVESANHAKEKNIYIDVDNYKFEKEIFDMPAVIIDFCKNTNQDIPAAIGEISRCFFESLALKYKYNIIKLESLISKKIELLHLVGGGSKNKLLCQWISNAAGIPLIAGPDETTVMGNILIQMKACNDISSISSGREVIINSCKLIHYEPENTKKWEKNYESFKKVLKL